MQTVMGCPGQSSPTLSSMSPHTNHRKTYFVPTSSPHPPASPCRCGDASVIVGPAGRGVEPLLTPQVVLQGGEGEPSEVAILSLRAIEVGQVNWYSEGPRCKEADKDGAQDTRNDEEDEEGSLGVDGGTHKAHNEAKGQQHGAIEQLIPVALGQDMDACAHFLPWGETSQDQWGLEGESLEQIAITAVPGLPDTNSVSYPGQRAG